jgi:p-aminobenzoyl-glutamate transporter AbgT
MKKLNWKHILLHFIALWFFAFAFQTFAFLSDLNLSELLRHTDNAQKAIIDRNYDIVALTNLNLTIALSNSIGLLTGFVISIIVSIKRKWPWINSLIVFIVIFSLGYLNLLGWEYLKNIFLLPGEALEGSWYYLLNGSMMLLTGLVLLIIKKPIEPKVGSIEKMHYA